MFQPPSTLTPGERLVATALAGTAALAASWLHARGYRAQSDPGSTRLASNLRDAANLAAVAVLSLALAAAGLDRPLAFLSGASALLVAEFARAGRMPARRVTAIVVVASMAIVQAAAGWTNAASALARRGLGVQG